MSLAETNAEIDDLAKKAAQIDALAAKASVTVEAWKKVSRWDAEGPSNSDNVLQSKGCSTNVGPLAGGRSVTLQTSEMSTGWITLAYLMPSGRVGAGAVTSVSIQRPETSPVVWPDSEQAMAALEAVLAGSSEASDLLITRFNAAVSKEAPWERWDWMTGRWEPVGD